MVSSRCSLSGSTYSHSKGEKYCEGEAREYWRGYLHILKYSKRMYQMLFLSPARTCGIRSTALICLPPDPQKVVQSCVQLPREPVPDEDNSHHISKHKPYVHVALLLWHVFPRSSLALTMEKKIVESRFLDRPEAPSSKRTPRTHNKK